MADVFISYARADRARVEALAAALSQAGLSVWWDREIATGEAFSRVIEKELAEAKAVVVAWSEAAINSDWVKDEASHAREAGKLFPIRLDGAKAPLGFQQYQAADFSQWSGAADAPFLTELIAALRRRADLPAPVEPAPAPAPPQKSAGKLGPRLLSGAAALIFALLIAGAATLGFSRRAPETPPTLAVMPFEDLTHDSTLANYAAGLQLELRDRVARVGGLRVIAESSAAAAAGLSAGDAGRKLGATLLLDGAVRKEGENVRIQIELVDAEKNAVVWTASEAAAPEDLASADAAVTSALLERLVVDLGAKVGAARKAPSPDAAFYRKELEMRLVWDEAATLIQNGDADASLAHTKRGVEIAREILASDPENVAALTAIGQVIAHAAFFDPVLAQKDPEDLWREALVYYDKALRADPDDPDALTALAEYQMRFRWNWRDAGRLIERAVAAAPNYPNARTWYAYYLSSVGRCREATAQAREAAALDPTFAWRLLALPRVLECATSNDAEVLALYNATLAEQPRNIFVATEIYLFLLRRGAADDLDALAERVKAANASTPANTDAAALLARIAAGAEAARGRPQKLRAFVEEAARVRAAGRMPSTVFGRRSNDLDYSLAVEAAFAGATETAIDFLDRALAARSLYIPETFPYGRYEFTAEMRASPRYKALWTRDPGLVELVRLRRAALAKGEMEGLDENGRVVHARPMKAAKG